MPCILPQPTLPPPTTHTHVSHQADVEQQDALSYNDVNNRSHRVSLSRQQKKKLHSIPKRIIIIIIIIEKFGEKLRLTIKDVSHTSKGQGDTEKDSG